MTRKHSSSLKSQRPAFDPVTGSTARIDISHSQLSHERALLRTLAHARNGESASEALEFDGFKDRILAAVMPQDFMRHEYRDLFEAIRDLKQAGDVVDAAHVTDRLKANGRSVAPAVVSEMFDGDALADSAQIESHIARVTQHSRLRTVEVMARKVADQARAARSRDDDFDLDAAVAELQAITFDTEKTQRIAADPKSEADALPAFVEQLEQTDSSRGFAGIDTGFKQLNHALNGLGAGLYVVAAPPGAGKTTFVKQLADNVARLDQLPVLFFTRDTSLKELRTMTLSRLAGVSTRDVANGPSDKEVIDFNGSVKVWSKIEAAAEEYAAFGSRMQLVEADLETTVSRIRLMAQAAKKKHNSARVLVVVDHLQALSIGAEARHLTTAKDRIDWIASELRRLAIDLDSPIVAVSNVSRTSYDGAPTLAAFRDSGGVEFGADVVCVLQTRPKQSVNGEFVRDVDVYILKNRFGATSRIAFNFIADRAKFDERGNAPTAIAYADTLKEAGDL